jgi:hypothetical protein
MAFTFFRVVRDWCGVRMVTPRLRAIGQLLANGVRVASSLPPNPYLLTCLNIFFLEWKDILEQKAIRQKRAQVRN